MVSILYKTPQHIPQRYAIAQLYTTTKYSLILSFLDLFLPSHNIVWWTLKNTSLFFRFIFVLETAVFWLQLTRNVKAAARLATTTLHALARICLWSMCSSDGDDDEENERTINRIRCKHGEKTIQYSYTTNKLGEIIELNAIPYVSEKHENKYRVEGKFNRQQIKQKMIAG